MGHRWDVANTVSGFFAATDARDWDTVTAMMTNTVRWDYHGLGGAPAAEMKRDHAVDSLKAQLPGFDRTHHQIGNVRVVVNSAAAHVETYLTAVHVIADDMWTVFGEVSVDLVRKDSTWRIAACALSVVHEAGATELPEKARQRVLA